MTVLEDPRFEGTVRLADGRRLGVAEFGPVSGRPVLWFHGTPGARRQIAPDARSLAWQQDIRIVSVERPGIGDSTPHAYRELVEFAHDIEHVGNALDLERFAVAGLSGGGPYALACAHEMPERVVMAAVLGGVAPAVGPEAASGGATPLVRLTAGLIGRGVLPFGIAVRTLVRILEPFGEQACDLFARTMPPGDQAVLSEPRVRRMFIEDIMLGSRRNMQAIFHDVALFGKPWGFSLEDVTIPVFLRYGDSDTIVPASHGHHLAERLPNAELRIYTGEGHLGSLGASREVLSTILKHWPASEPEPRPDAPAPEPKRPKREEIA